MQNEHPPDVLEAESLLKSALEHSDHGKRTACFEDALDILDSYISDHPETSQKIFIKNIRLTYTRKLLEALPSIRERDIDSPTFVRYYGIFTDKANKEFLTICEKYPGLEKEWKSYFDFFTGYIE
jgi:hypothetical protein